MATYNVPGLPQVNAPNTTARKDAYTNPQPIYDTTSETILQSQAGIMDAVKQWQASKQALNTMYRAEDQFYLDQLKGLDGIGKTNNKVFDDSVYNTLLKIKENLVDSYRDYYKDPGKNKEYIKKVAQSNKLVEDFKRVLDEGIIHGIGLIEEALKHPENTVNALSSMMNSDHGLMLMALGGRVDLPVTIEEEDGEYYLTTDGGNFNVGGEMIKMGKTRMNLTEFTNDLDIPTIEPADGLKDLAAEVLEDKGTNNVSSDLVETTKVANKVRTDEGEIIDGFTKKQDWILAKNSKVVSPETLTILSDGIGNGITISNPLNWALDEIGEPIIERYVNNNPVYKIDPEKVGRKLSGKEIATQRMIESGAFDEMLLDRTKYSTIAVWYADLMGKTPTGVLDEKMGRSADYEDTTQPMAYKNGQPGNWKGVTQENAEQVAFAINWLANKSVNDYQNENRINLESKPYTEGADGQQMSVGMMNALIKAEQKTDYLDLVKDSVLGLVNPNDDNIRQDISGIMGDITASGMNLQVNDKDISSVFWTNKDGKKPSEGGRAVIGSGGPEAYAGEFDYLTLEYYPDSQTSRNLEYIDDKGTVVTDDMTDEEKAIARGDDTFSILMEKGPEVDTSTGKIQTYRKMSVEEKGEPMRKRFDMGSKSGIKNYISWILGQDGNKGGVTGNKREEYYTELQKWVNSLEEVEKAVTEEENVNQNYNIK